VLRGEEGGAMTLEEIRGMLEKATPGPWTLNRHGYPAVYSPHEFVEAPDEGVICGIWAPEGHPYQGANAALIAAAPELAAQLVRAVELMQGLIPDPCHCPDCEAARMFLAELEASRIADCYPAPAEAMR